MDLWVGTRNGLVRLDENGPQRQIELQGVNVTALDVHGAGVWCIGDDATLRRRDGERWAPVAHVGDGDQFRCVRETTSGVLVGTMQGRLLRLEAGDLVPISSFDVVEGRDQWWNVGGLGESGNVRTIAEAPDGTLYVNVHVGGIYRSTDRGATWAPTIDQETDVHEVIAPIGSRVFAATGVKGLVRSEDCGESWVSVTEGLPSDGWGHGSYTRSVAMCGDGTVLITGSRGAFSNLEGGVLAGVYRWTDTEPERLERCTQGLPGAFEDNINTGCLTAGPGFAAFGIGDSVYVTEDSGRSWRVLANGLSAVNWVAGRR